MFELVTRSETFDLNNFELVTRSETFILRLRISSKKCNFCFLTSSNSKVKKKSLIFELVTRSETFDFNNFELVTRSETLYFSTSSQ